MSDENERRNAEPNPRLRASAAPKAAAAKGGRGKKIGHGLVVASATAVLAVYAAGYVATQSAAAQVAAQAAPPVAPGQAAAGATATGIPLPTATTVPVPTATSAPTPTSTDLASATPTSAAVRTATSAASAAPTKAPSATATSAPLRTAPSTPAPTATAAPAAASAYKDGTYTGAGTSRHGSIQATVVVTNGRIVSARITGSTTRYPTSRIAILPGEVLAQQGTTVNYVSGATDSSMAYLDAVANALAQAA